MAERPIICFIQYTNCDYYPTTYHLSRMLAAQGFRVVICCRADRSVNIENYEEGVELHRFGKSGHGLLSPIRFALFVLMSLWVVLRDRPRLVIGYDLHGLIAAGLIAAITGRPYFYHCYDIVVPEEGIGRFDGMLKRWEPYFSRRANAVIFPSQIKADYFSSSCELDKPPFVVTNSPPSQERSHSDLLARLLRDRHCQADFVVYYHGSIGPGKGLQQVVRSMPWWPAKTALVLLGVVYDQEYFDDLRALANSSGFEDNFHYFGVVPQSRLYDYTRSADLGIFVPDQDSVIHTHSGAAIVKLNDYLACGLPFVVSQMESLERFALETGAGKAVDVDDPQEIGEVIASLLNDSSARAAMAESGYQMHSHKYNLETQYAPTLNLIRELCSSEVVEQEVPVPRRSQG